MYSRVSKHVVAKYTWNAKILSTEILFSQQICNLYLEVCEAASNFSENVFTCAHNSSDFYTEAKIISTMFLWHCITKQVYSNPSYVFNKIISCENASAKFCSVEQVLSWSMKWDMKGSPGILIDLPQMGYNKVITINEVVKSQCKEKYYALHFSQWF